MAITKKKKEEEGEEEKKWKKISVDRGQDVEILEPLCIADGSVKWSRCCEKSYGNSSEKLNNYHMTQYFHFWEYTLKQWKQGLN